jgi:imidazolonepropionase-like amidohydrolase
MTRISKIPLRIFVVLWFCLRALSQVPESTQPIVIRAGTVLDGRGGTLHDVRITVQGSKIMAIDSSNGRPVDYDLRGLTVLPGWIDAHVHITWIFGRDGKNAGTDGTTQEDAYRAASNAWWTLMAGFTTVQSVGAQNDVPLRDAVALE